MVLGGISFEGGIGYRTTTPGASFCFLVVFACHSSRFVTLLLHFRLKKVSGLCCIIVGGGRP